MYKIYCCTYKENYNDDDVIDSADDLLMRAGDDGFTGSSFFGDAKDFTNRGRYLMARGYDSLNDTFNTDGSVEVDAIVKQISNQS